MSGLPCDLCGAYAEDGEAFWCCPKCQSGATTVTSARAEGHAAGVAEDRTRCTTWLTTRIEALLSAPVAMCGGPIAVEATFLALLEAREFAAGRDPDRVMEEWLKVAGVVVGKATAEEMREFAGRLG